MEYFPPRSGPLANVTRPVAVLKHAPKQLATASGLQFTTGYDDLDVLDWAEIQGRLGRCCALVRHRNAPESGTEIVVSSTSPEPWMDVLDVLSALRLSQADLKWSHPDIQAKLKPRTHKTASAKSRAGSRLRVTGPATRSRRASTSRSGIQRKSASRAGRRPSRSVRSSRKK
jgi:hypothetical protein